MSEFNQARALLFQLARWPNWTDPTLFTPEAIREFEARNGLSMPQQLREWLAVCNGACAGPGGILGIRPANAFIDIETVLALYPDWKGKRWIPIAGDGCGNYYLLVPEGYVSFFDTQCDPADAMYVVASDLGHFFTFLFKRQLGEEGWPFSKHYVTSQDPAILSITEMPLAWDK